MLFLIFSELVIFRLLYFYLKLELEKEVYKGVGDIFYIRKFFEVFVYGFVGYMIRDN